MKRRFADGEVRAFVEQLPSKLGYRAMAARCREEFGRDRAWGAPEIKVFWTKVRWGRRRFHWKRDAKVRAVIDDSIGRLPVREIMAKCRRRFGAKRTPSRSTLYSLQQQSLGLYRVVRRR